MILMATYNDDGSMQQFIQLDLTADEESRGGFGGG
jgi:hypothetical protein